MIVGEFNPVGEFSPADDAESEVFAFDFAARLGASETLSSSGWTIKVVSGVDPTPTARLVGSTNISGTQSKQRLAGLVAGATYELTAVAVTSAGNTLALVGYVTCES